MNFACENEARAAYEQFASEPHPDGFVEVYPSWEDLEDVHKQLWYRVATAAINGQVVENLAGKGELQVSGNAVCVACQKDCSLHKVNVPGKTGAGFDWLCPPEPVAGNYYVFRNTQNPALKGWQAAKYDPPESQGTAADVYEGPFPTYKTAHERVIQLREANPIHYPRRDP